jgi:hypothetical protein
MTSVQLAPSLRRTVRTAAIGGLAFTGLYIVHRILQGTGPGSATAAAVAAYNVEHRSILVASEVAVGLALLAFIPFVAALVVVIGGPGRKCWPSRSLSAVPPSSPWALYPPPLKPP